MRTYMTSGLLASAAGLIMIARTNQAKADYGESYILQAVLVNLLAGVNWAGGFGRVVGVFIAVVTLQLLSSGFNMLRFNNFARDFTWGVFLIVVMVFNYVMNERKARREAGMAGQKAAS
jgi:simple sugar transport system permease protein